MSGVNPTHLLNPNNYTTSKIAQQRLEICKQCPEIIPITYQCKKCGCFMGAKTRLKMADCPLKKW